MLELQYNKDSKTININAYRFDNYRNYGKDLECCDTDLNITSQKYPLGELLINLIYTNSAEINEIIKNLESTPLPTNLETYNNYIDIIWSTFDKLVEIHPYFESLYSPFSDLIDSYCMSIHKSNGIKYISMLENHTYNLFNEVPKFKDVDYPHDYDFANNKIVDSIKDCFKREFGYLSDQQKCINTKTLEKYIDFCFFDTIYPEFNELSPLDKFKIFDLMDIGGYSQILFSTKFVIENLNELIDELDFEDRDITSPMVREELAEYIRKSNQNLFAEYYVNIQQALILEFLLIISNTITIKKCNNCNKYFIPEKREDEVYCNRINSKGNTCKEIGWDNKPKSKEYIEYRKKYNIFLQFKNRNRDKFDSYSFKTSLDTLFDCWKQVSLNKMRTLENIDNNTSEYEYLLDEYLEWLDNSYKGIQRIVKGGYTLQEEYLLNIDRRKDLLNLIENMSL